MPKRRAKQAVKTVDPSERLRKALAARTKAELIDALMELAEDNRRVMRQLDERFDVEATPDELVRATRQAIADATYFDKRDVNRNFDYDHAAYDAVKRNLARLVGSGQFRPAMDLSLELMVKGSQQIEMSDEGLMTDEVEECLRVVIEGLAGCGLPADEVAAWCDQMLAADSMGFVCNAKLKSLRRQFETVSR
jgi:hypothetical protein